MEKTIKAEINRRRMHSKLLNENSLLVISKGEKDASPILSIRYVEHDSIKEDGIASFLPTTVFRYNDKIIGVFAKTNTGEENDLLVAAYDLEEHTFVENDLLKAVYYSKSNKDKPMQYIKTPNS